MEKETMLAVMSIGLFAAITLSIYFIMRFRAVRIENNGIQNVKREPYDWQKPGIVVLGIGTGIFIVGILREFNYFHSEDSIPMGIITICAGISMIVANKLDKRQEPKD
ncbi:hypothetical protein SAMN05660841_02305 [Sphingobacterium nematocida]|uniref:Uncharacterized protein n=1 Tax=Sphingobacterium nematocida TaxID=1513896 RepID=A0A1T5E1K0_9SPHI|nr:hypothetical protein [Sphingobacterium nematocida]SKB77573.1 hypothetical protein SAMN05660841_02305 [Sphingobacterium nematocida]